MSVLVGHKLRATRMITEFVGSGLARSWKGLSMPSFAFRDFASDADPMMKTLSNAANENEAASRLAGARILVMEKCFEALVDQMIADGSEPTNAAVVLMEHLAERFAGRRPS